MAKTIRLTVGQAIVKYLENQFIDIDGKQQRLVEKAIAIFGHGCVVGIGEALEDKDHSIKVYQGKSEQGMGNIAIGYAKQSNRQKIMPVVSSIGPGALNMVTAAGTATVNRIPLLLFPGDSYADRQPDPVLQQIEQEFDPTITANDAFKPVCKFWDRISRPEQLMSSLDNAFRVLTDPAQTGAVCIALPQDTQAESYDYPLEFFEKKVWYYPRKELTASELTRIKEVLKNKKKPLLLCGGGVRYSQAGKEILALAQDFNLPITETQAGKGTLLWENEHVLGGTGTTGTLASNKASHECDLVIAVGTRLNDFHTASKSNFHNPNVEFMTFNVNGYDAHKMRSHAFTSDAKAALSQLRELFTKEKFSFQWKNRIAELKQEWNEEVDKLYSRNSEKDKIAQTTILGILNKQIPSSSIIVTAAGSLPSDLERVWRVRSQGSYHAEYGFSCMGYEVAGAIGAKIAEPDREVFVLLGDGSYAMLHTELLTAIQENIKINIILVDNHGFQCIDNLQTGKGIPHFCCESRYRNPSTDRLDGDYMHVDFAQNAQSWGALGYTVHTEQELNDSLQKILQQDKSNLLHIHSIVKSMTSDYDTFWRVGIPATSKHKAVVEQHQKQEKVLENVRKW